MSTQEAAKPVRIRIHYVCAVEETDAVPLGPYPDGSGQLFRVARPSICIAGVAREDVVRLEPEGDNYVFLEVVERSSWERRSFLLPRDATGALDALAEFEQAIAQAGCILDGESVDVEASRYVVSVPPGASADVLTPAHERMMERMVGMSVSSFAARVGEAARQRNVEHHAREARKQHAWRRRQRRVEIARRLRSALIAVACVAAAIWWIYALATGTPQQRPRIAALAMVVAFSPSLVFTLGAGFREPILGAMAAALAALFVAGHLADPAYASLPIPLGLIFLILAGPVGFLFGMFSGFSSSERALKQVWLFLVLPCLVSCIAAVVYIVTALRASHAG